MNNVLKTIEIELYSPTSYEVIKAQQGDHNSRIIELILYEQGQPYEITGNISFWFTGYRGNGSAFFREDCIKTTEDNHIIITLTNDILYYPGTIEAKIVMYDTPNHSVLSTIPFQIVCIKTPCHESSLTQSEKSIITDLIFKVEESSQAATEILKGAIESATSAANSANSAKNSEEIAREYKNTSIESATSAANNANVASEKAEEASASAQNAEDYSLVSKSYAVGEGNVRENESVDNAKYYYEQAKQISQGLEGSLLPMGTISFSQLNGQMKQAGYMYNISDSFVTNNTFKEGSGHAYPPGTNVYYTADGYWDCLAGVMVTSVNGKNGDVLITPENIGATPMIRSSPVPLTPSTTGEWYRLGQVNHSSNFFGIFTVTHNWNYNHPIVSRFVVGASCVEQVIRSSNIKEIFFTSKNGKVENKIVKKARVIYIPVGTDEGNIYVDVFLQGSESVNSWSYTLETTYKNWVDGKFAKNPVAPTSPFPMYPYVADEFSFTDEENADTATKLKTARTIDGVSFDGSADITHFGVCETAGATAAKTVSIPNFKLVEGARVIVKFKTTNSANFPTLNVNETGAKSIKNSVNTSLTSIDTGILKEDRPCEFVFDGSYWILIGDYNEDTGNKRISFASMDSTTSTGWSGVSVMGSGETHNSLFNKISTMFKNVRYLYKLLGKTDISAIGDGTVTGILKEMQTKTMNITTSYTSTGAINCVYNSNACTLALRNIENIAATTNIKIATLPKEIRPRYSLYWDNISPSGGHIRTSINSEGEVYAYRYNNLDIYNLGITLTYLL